MPRDEDLLTEAIDILNSFALHTVSQDWIDSVWDAQFTECEELPADYEDSISHVNLPNQFSRLADISKSWIRLQNQGEVTRLEETTTNADANIRKSFWDALIDQDIKYKVLIGLLYLFMERAQAQGQVIDQQTRDLGIKSASLYFILLGIPGSGAFNIFHAVLYNKALDTFKLIATLNLAKKSPKKKAGRGGASQASQSRGRGRGSQARASQARASQRSRHGSGGSNNSEGSDDDTGPELTQREVNKLFGQLNNVLDSLLILLDNCSLKRSSESLEATVTSLVELTLLETQFSDLDFDGNRTYGELSGLAVSGYIGLEKLSAQLHGGRTVLHVFKGLMPSILTVPRGASDMTGRALSNIRELALKFIKHLVRRDTEDVVASALLILVQHLAVKVPDKTDYRKLAADSIVALLEEMSLELYRRAVKWFVIFCHTDKSTHRLFSLEVLGRLISSTPPQGGTPEASTIPHPASGTSTPAHENMDSDSSGTPVVAPGTSTPADPPPAPPGSPRPQNESAVSLSPKYLFATIYGRCADVSASTRAQALKTLGEITADGGSVTSDIVKELLSEVRTGTRDKRPLSELLQDEEVDLDKIDPLPSSKEFIDFLRRRALDQSVFVRKSALQVLENVLKLSGSLMSGDLIKVLAEHCRDSSLAVRKQMVISLTELLKMYPENDELLNIWVEGVFPLILDAEAKAAETVLERIWEVLFQNMVSVDKARTAEQSLPWAILDSVEKQKMTNYLSRACNTWAKENKLTVKILNILQSYIGSPHNASAWMLLATVTQHVPCREPRFVLDYFNQSIQNPDVVGLYTLQQVLKVLFSSVSRLSEEDRLDLQANLLRLVSNFKIPPDLIQVAVDVITVVSHLESGENLKHYQSSVDGWAVPIIEDIDTNLSEVILRESNEISNPNQTISEVPENKMMRQIFTLGELAQICPLRINRRLFLLMQSIIFQKGEKTNKPQVTQDEQTIPASQTQRSQAPTCVFVPSKKLQALTIVTLCKMCLQHEEQAQKIIPAFGAILTTSSDSSIKNNIMYMLTDMCVRFASLVDPLLPAMTSCLKDKSISVRRTTLILLIHLLQEDFLKIRGNSHFFLRILMTLQDPSEDIRGLTIFYIQQRLLKKIPNIMYSLFTETLFHLNEYRHNNETVVLTDKEKKLFSLTGDEHRETRIALYKFMLENMNDTHRFTTTHRLCQDILNGVVEKTIKLEGPGHDLLKDTLHILSSDEIKLASLKSRGGGEDEEGGDNLEAALVAATKKQIITQVVKKNTIENILPIVIALKTKLTEDKSPLVGEVFNFLRKLMEDYKGEVDEILDANKQLASEIAYDIRMYEEREEKEREEMERQKEIEEREKARRAAAPPEPELPGSPGLASVQKALLETARRGKGQAGLMAETVLKNLLRNAEAVADVTAGTPAKALAGALAEEEVEEPEADSRGDRSDNRRRTIGGIGVRRRESSGRVDQGEVNMRKSCGGVSEIDKVKNRVRELLNNSKKTSPEKGKDGSRMEEATGEERMEDDTEEESNNVTSTASKSTLGSDLEKDTPRRNSRSRKLSPEKEKRETRIEKGAEKRNKEDSEDDSSSTTSNTTKTTFSSDLDKDTPKTKSKELNSENMSRIEETTSEEAAEGIEDNTEDKSNTSTSTATKSTIGSDPEKDTRRRRSRGRKLSPEKDKGGTRIEKEIRKGVEKRMEDSEDDSASTTSNTTKNTFNSDLDKDTPKTRSNEVSSQNMSSSKSTGGSDLDKDTPTHKTRTNSDLDTPESLEVQPDNTDLNKSYSKTKTVETDSTDNTADSLAAQPGGEATKDLSSQTLNSDPVKDACTDQIEATTDVQTDGKEPTDHASVPEDVEPEKESRTENVEAVKPIDKAEQEKEEKRQKQEKAAKEKEEKRRKHKKEEEKRRIQTEIAKIRVQINMKKDDLDEAVKDQDFTNAQVIKKQLDKLDNDAAALKLQLAAAEEPSPQKDADTSRRISGQGVNKNVQKDVEKSKRISGHTRMENDGDSDDTDGEDEVGKKVQTVQHKTPTVSKAKRLHALRAISTPHVDQTILGRPDVTFLGESAHDISAISNLSPQSTLSLGTTNVQPRRSNDRQTDDTDAISFRFRRGGREMFDDLFEGVEKRNSGKGDGAANKDKEATEESENEGEAGKKRRTKTPRSSLERIVEDSQESNDTNVEEEPREKRKRKGSANPPAKKKSK